MVTQKGVKILLINLAVLLAGLLVLELLFGGWFHRPVLSRLNLIRDVTITRDVSNLYDTENPIITYTRDEYGLRGNFDKPNVLW